MKRMGGMVTIGFSLIVLFGAPIHSYGFDYFTAQQDGKGEYLRILESAHVNTVPHSISINRLDNALGDLKYTLERFPNHPRGLQLMGVVSQILKKPGLAVSYYHKAIEQFPRYAVTRAQFGLYLVGIGDLDDGINMLIQSVEIDPRFPGGHAGLAHAYAKKGEMSNARDAAAKARELGFKGQLPPGL